MTALAFGSIGEDLNRIIFYFLSMMERYIAFLYSRKAQYIKGTNYNENKTRSLVILQFTSNYFIYNQQ